MKIIRAFILTFVIASAFMQGANASSASVEAHAETLAALSMSLALDAATESIKSCAAKV